MISKEEIKIKERYILEQISKITTKEELEKLKYSLRTYLVIDELEKKDENIITYINNLLNKICFDNNLMEKCKNINNMLLTLNDFAKPVINDNYLLFILKLVQNLCNIETMYIKDCKKLNYYKFEAYKAISISYQFYSYLGDEELLDNGSVILSNPSHYSFKNKLHGYRNTAGLVVEDNYFNKPYIYCTNKNNLFTYQTFNHEVMHAIDFYMNSKLSSTIFNGFDEIPTYTIDYLFLDFLEQNNYNINDIKILRRKTYNYIQNLAKDISINLVSLFLLRYGIPNKDSITYDNIRSIISKKMYSMMFELVSCIIAEGLYRQILEDKKYGLENLKTIIKNPILKDNIPDFAFVNLDNETLIYLSQNMINDRIKCKIK